MPEISIAPEPSAAPARALARHVTEPTTKKLSLDDLTDRALRSQEEDQAARAAKRGARPTKPEELPSADELLDEVMDPEPEGQEEQEEPEEQEDPDEQEAPDTRGSKEDPFTLKDLPKDKFIALKVDGEKVVIPIAEAFAGYVREKVFHQRVEQMQGHMQQLEGIVQEAREMKTGVRQEIMQLFKDPEKLHDILRDNYEDTLHELARRRVADVEHWKKYPGTRDRFLAEQQQRRVEAQQRGFQAQQEAQQRSQQEQHVIEQRVKVLRPGWMEGLRRVGNPAPSKELTRMVGLAMQQQLEETKRALTSDEVADIVERVAKFLNVKPASAKPPKPADIFSGRARRPSNDNGGPRPSRGGKDFSQMTRRDKMKDPDYFLRGFKGLR